ncbi:juxtaposed with another zinc finger protein 1 isoform X1 [Homo sapiens]|uniref:juxtaposed with another zinc finger protein 1 isoform X1 n=1 Tax=Homo sapiens TaxID=9606 RepID=UPI001FB0F721|nr:juxtaposed with another zinc finger protein 1 isoform X1 [Homo sapiens]
MTGIAAASFFSNTCRFGGCGLHFPTLADLIEHIEDNHIDTDPRVLEKQELQQPTYVALSYINRFMTDAARREQESLKKKIQPKLSLTLSSSVSRGNVSTPPRHSSGSLTPPVTPPITPSSSFRSSTPTENEIITPGRCLHSHVLPALQQTRIGNNQLVHRWMNAPRICVYICIYIHVYVYVYIRTCTYTYVHVYVYIYVYICIHTHTMEYYSALQKGDPTICHNMDEPEGHYAK